MRGLAARTVFATVLIFLLATGSLADTAPQVLGPWHAEFPAGGDSLQKTLAVAPDSALLEPNATWSLFAWIHVAESPVHLALIAGLGDPTKSHGRFLALRGQQLLLWTGDRAPIVGSALLSSGAWHFIAATSDGQTLRLYANGAEVGRGNAGGDRVEPIVQLAPRKPSGADVSPFAGRIAGFSIADRALSAEQLKKQAVERPDPTLIDFESGSPSWPVQVRQMVGQISPQDAWTRPKSRATYSKPVAKAVSQVVSNSPALQSIEPNEWTIAAWRLAEAPKVSADGAKISEPAFDSRSWHIATVPGTVLTTLVDRGVYPDPDFGLNNLAIPESLNKQAYWYRSEFEALRDLADKHLLLTFNGVNYAADVWLNGQRLGAIKGAFIRGRFDVTGKLHPGARNAIAVRVSPPPHPGIAHEESLTAGVGENGGLQALDGPTFIASEGWDWIPSVRDRNTGLWQDVTLTATAAVRIGDTQVVTSVLSPERAQIEISVPLVNLTQEPVQAEVRASFDNVAVSKKLTLPPGSTTVKLTPEEFAALDIASPRLWWPNGYGSPELYRLKLVAKAGDAESDQKTIRFGIRQVTYELSLMDRAGRLRRVEVDLTKARARGERIIDVRHEAIRKVADGWATSLYPDAEKSPAVTALPESSLTPHLVIKVNGVRIAAKGGNWGTDDWRKRVSREKLEPYFRLHRDAHLNVIRNWVGQNTERVFFDLADEYGLMVLNDFWASTQDYQLEPQDVPLFLKNAADVIARFRNHPSIILWFGRNEGVPQPILNEGLDRLVAELDGTRYYTGSSNRVNLANSGPYNYREPVTYFTEHAQGFSVEVGTPSFPTLESFKRAVPAPDRWPISDVWAYHDWHQTGNGTTATFMATLEKQFGAATSLEDFERKAQMMNYVTHRAMFEGMNAKLWTRNSGRLLWMTQPAWPSTMWQILSSDYDTHGSFYGVKKASEPVHVQMNLPDYAVVLVNNTTLPLSGVSVRARVLSLDNKVLLEREATLQGAPISVSPALALPLETLMETAVVLVKLEARDASGKLLSENVYWQSKDAESLRRLGSLAQTRVTATTTTSRNGDETLVRVRLRNGSAAPALAIKLTLFRADGTQVLPAYFDDNYISLLPGETRDVDVSYPASAGRGGIRLMIRGWNVAPSATAVSARSQP